MTTVNANEIALGIESFGHDDAPLVLLAGGTTMLSWPASRTSGASSSPNDSMPKAISLALTVVIGSPEDVVGQVASRSMPPRRARARQ